MSIKLFKQANALTIEKKATAMEFYAAAIRLVAHKGYNMPCRDHFANLSAEFGVLWLGKYAPSKSSLIADLYAEANNAFNYAHLTSGAGRKFIENAKKILTQHEICDDKKLREMATDVNFCATAVTRQQVIDSMPQYFLA